MKVIFLGTNGWYDTSTGNTICILARSQRYDIVFDAGNGFAKLDRHLSGDESPVFLFLSHFHLDHLIGLHTLAKFRFSKGLTICGPAGTRDVLHTLVNTPFTMPLHQLPYPIRLLELPEQSAALPFSTETRPLLHASLTLGYRIEVDGKVIAYCPDTGHCENAVVLARSADLLIAECAFRAGQTNESWPHLNPEASARIAREGKAKQLALVHFDAVTHPDMASRQESEAVAKKIFSKTLAAEDGMEMVV